jgi:tetratricopeptide (TPR) repeat protein
MKIQMQQQVETERLKRSFCQTMLDTAAQFSPVLTQNFFEQLAPIVPHLGESVAQPMWSYVELNHLSLIVAAIVSFHDFDFLRELETSSGIKTSADGMVIISGPGNAVKVTHHVRAIYSKSKKFEYLQAVIPQNTWLDVDPLIEFATVLLIRGEYENAKIWYEMVLSILSEELNDNLIKKASIWNKLGILNSLRTRYEEAESAYEKAQSTLGILSKQTNIKKFEVAEILNNLGVLYCHKGRFSQAKSLLGNVLEIHQEFSVEA